MTTPSTWCSRRTERTASATLTVDSKVVESAMMWIRCAPRLKQRLAPAAERERERHPFKRSHLTDASKLLLTRSLRRDAETPTVEAGCSLGRVMGHAFILPCSA